MAKNIIIKEGNIDKQFTATTIKTRQVGSNDVVDWIPTDEWYEHITLPTRTFTRNGVYDPEDEDKHGFGVVTISVPGGYDLDTVYYELLQKSY